jgi:hypothetical protein
MCAARRRLGRALGTDWIPASAGSAAPDHEAELDQGVRDLPAARDTVQVDAPARGQDLDTITEPSWA